MASNSENWRARPHVGRLLAALILVSGVLVTDRSAATADLEGLAPERGAEPRVQIQEETGAVGFIGTAPGSPIETDADRDTPPARVATDFLRQRADELGLHASATDLAVHGQHRTAIGGWSVRVGQEYDGIPVFGGEFTVNLDRNRDILSVLGEASPISRATTSPTVDAADAAALAIARVARAEGVPPRLLHAAPPELRLYDPRLVGAPDPLQEARLSWVIEVRAASPPVAHTVVVDAQREVVSLDFSSLTHDLDRRICDYQNLPREESCTTPVWTEISQPPTGEPEVELAFEFAEDFYDFFFDHFGRDSVDGKGFPLTATVDACPENSSPTSCPWRNASSNGREVKFGDGYAAADDVVAHEFTHNYTRRSSALFYYMQSGAINEALSDIFGEFIDFANSAGSDGPTHRWLHGEDITGSGTNRDMAHPPAFNDPDRMGSPLYHSAESDSGGVHTNSGVANKAAYLLTDGDTFNGQTVSGLGSTKAARLFFTVNDDMLVSGSDYNDLANALTQACANLAGAAVDGFTEADCTEVEKTIAATEMDENPSAAPTRTTTQCPPGEPYATAIRLDDLEGSTAYTPQTVTGSEVTASEVWRIYSGYATSGVRSLYGDDPDEVSDTALRMTAPITLPDGAILHFRHAFGFEDDEDQTYDGGVLEYSTDGESGPWEDAGPLMSSSGRGGAGYTGLISDDYDNPLAGRPAFVDDSHGYGSSRVDLSSLAGESVLFRWRIGTDSEGADRGWFIDDIRFLACSATPPDTTSPQTSITKHPPKRTYSRSARFWFRASEAGASFECKIDRKGWRPCHSPIRYRVGRGTHTFRVSATDEAGNRDASPAAYRWQVRRR